MTSPPDLVSELFKLSERRGKDSTGLAALNFSGVNVKLSLLKRASRARELLRSSEYHALISAWLREIDTGPSVIIGHSRLATNGSQLRPENNQPVVMADAVGIHNGIVVNDKDIWPTLKRARTAEVDSEVIFTAIAESLKEGKSLKGAVNNFYQKIKGTASIAALFQESQSLLLATNNGSIYYATSPGPLALVFASERRILEAVKLKFRSLFADHFVQQLPANSALNCDLHSAETSLFRLDGGGEIEVEQDQPSPVPFTVTDFSPQFIDSVNNVSSQGIPREFEEHFLKRVDQSKQLRRCTRCILPETMPFIAFDTDGVCNFCKHHVPVKPHGHQALEQLAEKQRHINEGRCLMGVSGGRDSCYALHYVKKHLGLDPVAFTYDWGMVTDLARRNINRLCGALGVEHILIAADIATKRRNIALNVAAWLKRPNLGLVPLFMAGDKHYFAYANSILSEIGTKMSIMSENPLERTTFKSGFAGVPPAFLQNRSGVLPLSGKLKLSAFYVRESLKNPSYLNVSLFDSLLAYGAYYFLPHDFMFLFHYLTWNEHEVVSIIRELYDWEISTDTPSTWRIGDGTTPFYNYVYFTIAGFNENDTFLSNCIREGRIGRAEALDRLHSELCPRWDSLRWYFDAIKIDFQSAIRTVNQVTPLFNV